jgi:copper transport protein
LREVVNWMAGSLQQLGTPRRRLPRLTRGRPLPGIGGRPPRRLLLEALIVLALVLVAAALGAPRLEAHAVLVATQPEDGSILQQAPRALVLQFDNPVEVALGGVQVTDAGGRRVDRGRPEHPGGDGRVVSVPLRHDLSGAYSAAWRVTSDDGHQVSDSISFIVRGGGGEGWLAAGGSGGGGSGRLAGALLAGTRFALFASLVLLVGGLAFLVAIWPQGAGAARVRQLLAGSWTAAVVATVAAIPLQGVVATGAPLGDVLDTELLGEVLATRYGRVSTVRLGILCAAVPLLLIVSRRPELARPGTTRWFVPLAGLLGAGLLATPGLAGHAGNGRLVPLGVAADLLHLAAVSVWLGGLVVLVTAVLPRREPAELRRVVPRFSELAFDAVVVIVISGLYQAWRQVGQPSALTSTTYGRLLLAKVAVAAVLVGFGALSRRVVQDRLVATGTLVARPAGPGAARLDPDVAAVARLRRSIGAEVAIAALVLALTSVLVNTDPAASASAAGSPAALAGPFSTSLATTTGTVSVEVAPARVGVDQVELATLDQRGRPAAVDRLEAKLRDPTKGGAQLTVTLAKTGQGRYGGTVRIPSPGWWQLALTISRGDLEETQVTTLSIR